MAWATAWRIRAAEPTMQSRRVWLTISMMVGTPRPSSPTIVPRARSSSISLDAFERLPSLSFSRWILKALRVPSSITRGTRKQERPPGAWASTRKASHMGAEQNHLWPVIRCSAPAPERPTGSARVVLARTSEPPCFSVMAMPISTPRFSAGGLSPGS